MVREKKALTSIEQVEYLKKYKNVDFSTYGEKEAAEYLKFNNYINVITPFKFYYAKPNPRRDYELLKEPIEIDGILEYRHVYDGSTKFEKYVNRYEEERKNYPIIYKNIITFKSTLKSLITYHLLTNIEYETREDISDYIIRLKLNIINLRVLPETAKIIGETLDEICELIKDSYNVFHTLYSLSLRQVIDLYNVLDIDIKTLIFEELKDKNLVFGTSNCNQLHDTMIKIKDIRNAVMHNDSLEIVTRYKSSAYEKNTYRKPTPRKSYKALIEKLEEDFCWQLKSHLIIYICRSPTDRTRTLLKWSSFSMYFNIKDTIYPNTSV